MKQPVWTREHEVASFLANPQKRLGLCGLLALLQDAAWRHAEHLGFGFESIAEQRRIWVLTRQKVVMRSWPAWGETVRVRTWVRPSSGPLASRDYEVTTADGAVVGACTTSWLVVDSTTRRPARLDLSDADLTHRVPEAVPFTAPKIPLRDDLVHRARFDVRNSDLDVNQHVNNVRYAQWILDSVPLDWHRRFTLLEYEVNFLDEARAGDVVSILRSDDHHPDGAPFRMQFQGLREADNRTVFAARLTAVSAAAPDSDAG